MQPVWFPIPVATLFRRIVNVVSTFSISHHYLSQPRPSDPDPRPPYSLRWPAWLSDSAFSPQGFQRIFHVDSHAVYSDFALEQAPIQDPPPHSASAPGAPNTDQIHRLMDHPALYDPVRKPRFPIVLCHGQHPPPAWTSVADLHAGQDSTGSTSGAPPLSPSCSSTTGRTSSASCATKSGPRCS